jgi:hypothetical protein
VPRSGEVKKGGRCRSARAWFVASKKPEPMAGAHGGIRRAGKAFHVVHGESTMKVMVFVKASADSEAGKLPSAEEFREMGAFNEQLVKAGVMLAGEGLLPSSRAKRVRCAGSQRMVIDGPFSETKELVAGFWLWQVKSIDEAVEWVRRAPFREGEIEIRPVYGPEDFGTALPDDVRQKEATLRAQTESRKS